MSSSVRSLPVHRHSATRFQTHLYFIICFILHYVFYLCKHMHPQFSLNHIPHSTFFHAAFHTVFFWDAPYLSPSLTFTSGPSIFSYSPSVFLQCILIQLSVDLPVMEWSMAVSRANSISSILLNGVQRCSQFFHGESHLCYVMHYLACVIIYVQGFCSRSFA